MPDPSDPLANDPLEGRHPTSHEQRTGTSWDESYRDGPAPWDIGQPQPAVVRLASRGAFTGAVLDAGCGTGENAFHIASLGLSVLGVDVAETALAMARKMAQEKSLDKSQKKPRNGGLNLEFALADANHLDRLGRTFNTVLDSGLFHTFESEEHPEYVASLASVTRRDGTLYVLCFADQGPDLGPHPVTKQELQSAFNAASGWQITALEPERLATRFHVNGVSAWLATIQRL